MVASLCREMGWTYTEYMEQPEWFTETLRMMMQVEGEKAREQQESDGKK